MNDDELDAVLRHNLAGYDLPRDRVAEIREEAHRHLRDSARRATRRWYTFEAGASLAVAAAQLVWVLSTVFGR